MSEAREAKAGSAVAPQQNPVQLQHAQAAFPKAARLLKTDEFSSVFRLRPWRRTPHFVVYARPTGNDARLGLVIGKKFAARAATRNLIKRQSREAFRLRRAEFGGWDVLLRLHTRIDKKAFPSAASLPLKALARGEIETLLDKVAREIKRREAMPVPVDSDEAAASSKAQRASDAPGASSGTASPGTSAAGEAVAAAPAKVSSKPERRKP